MNQWEPASVNWTKFWSDRNVTSEGDLQHIQAEFQLRRPKALDMQSEQSNPFEMNLILVAKRSLQTRRDYTAM